MSCLTYLYELLIDETVGFDWCALSSRKKLGTFALFALGSRYLCLIKYDTRNDFLFLRFRLCLLF